MQSCGGQPEIKMKLRSDLSLSAGFGGVKGAIIIAWDLSEPCAVP